MNEEPTIDPNHWKDFMSGHTLMEPRPRVVQSFEGVGEEVYPLSNVVGQSERIPVTIREKLGCALAILS